MRLIDVDKVDETLHNLLNMIKQEKETAKNERERKRKSDIAAGIVLAIYALRDVPIVDHESIGWVDDESMPNEDERPDNEFIGW